MHSIFQMHIIAIIKVGISAELCVCKHYSANNVVRLIQCIVYNKWKKQRTIAVMCEMQ